MSNRWEPVEIEIDLVIAETDKAILVTTDVDDDEGVWIPKSCLGHDSEVTSKGDRGTLVIARWLAEEKGLV